MIRRWVLAAIFFVVGFILGYARGSRDSDVYLAAKWRLVNNIVKTFPKASQ